MSNNALIHSPLYLPAEGAQGFCFTPKSLNTMKAKLCIFMHRTQVQTNSNVLYRIVDFNLSLQYSFQFKQASDERSPNPSLYIQQTLASLPY